MNRWRSSLLTHSLAIFVALSAAFEAEARCADAPETCRDSRLSLQLAYKKKIVEPADYDALPGAFFAGRSRILLESKDHELFLCDTNDGSVVWQTKTSKLICGMKGFEKPGYFPTVICARFEKDGSLELILGGVLRAVYVRYTHGKGVLERYDLSRLVDGELAAIYAIPRWDNLILAVHGWDRRMTVPLIDLRRKEAIWTLRPKPVRSFMTHLAFSRDGKYGAATGDSVYVWDLTTGERLNDAYQPDMETIKEWKRTGAGYVPEGCTFSNDGGRLIVATEAGHILVFDVQSGELLHLAKCVGPTGPCKVITFLGESEIVFIGGRTLGFYDFKQQQGIKFYGLEPDKDLFFVNGIAVAGNSLFVCDMTGHLRRYDWTIADDRKPISNEADQPVGIPGT